MADSSRGIPDVRRRDARKPSKKAVDTPEEILARMAEQVARLDAAVAAMDGKLDAILRHLYLPADQLDAWSRVRAGRFPSLSQHEEAGLLLGLFREVGTSDRRFVDVGAGVNGGNSGFFAREAGWSGLLVDEAPQCIEALTALYEGAPAQVVSWSVTPTNINALFEEHGFTGEVDLFSLDVDGPDYWVWEGLTVCAPRVVVLEYNSTFGPEAAVTIPYDREYDVRLMKGLDKTYFGASLSAFARLGARKGYRLIGTDTSGANAVFLRKDVGPQFAARTPKDVFRWLPKHRNIVDRMGGDALAYFSGRNLPLVAVESHEE